MSEETAKRKPRKRRSPNKGIVGLKSITWPDHEYIRCDLDVAKKSKEIREAVYFHLPKFRQITQLCVIDYFGFGSSGMLSLKEISKETLIS